MAGMVEKFGHYVDKQEAGRPGYARWLLLTAYRLYGWKMKHFPNSELSAAKNYLGTVSMGCMVNPLAHPEKQILTSIFTPCEVFHAMGLYPMCAEQYSTYANGAGAEHGFIEAAENAGVAETFCSYHKVVTGAMLTGVMPKPLAIVNTSLACDANNLTFRKAAEHFNVPQFYIDVPYRPSKEAVDYVAGQLREMTAWLSDLSGIALNPEKLVTCVKNARETVQTLREIIRKRRDTYVASELTAELYEALMVHNALGLPETLRYARMLKEEFASAQKKPGRKLLWMHSNPFYQGAVKSLFNYKEDPWIALTEMCYDPLLDKMEEDPYRFMAQRLVYNSYNGPIQRRIEKAIAMAKEIEADGIILFCHWGCKETCGASSVIKERLEEAGFPVLLLNGDGVDRRNVSDGQIQTRIGAFLEMLDGRGEKR